MRIQNQVILSHIKRRINRNANALILVIGDTGSGKSYFALDFALQISQLFEGTEFNIDWTEFSAKPILKTVLRPHKKGQPVLLDEMGIAMSARKWQSKENIGLSFLLQTVRYMNHVILFTVPQISFVDVVARKLFHYVVTVKPRFRNNKNYVSFYKIKENRKNPNYPYFIRIPFKKSDGSIHYATTYETKLPPQWLIDDYEKKRTGFIEDIYKKQLDILEGLDKKKEPETTAEICPKCGMIFDVGKGKSANCQRCGTLVKGVAI